MCFRENLLRPCGRVVENVSDHFAFVAGGEYSVQITVT
jgi:hypothetical protein